MLVVSTHHRATSINLGFNEASMGPIIIIIMMMMIIITIMMMYIYRERDMTR